jgi:hypothetical protein
VGNLPGLDVPIYSQEQQKTQALVEKILMAREQDRLKANPVDPDIARIIGYPQLSGKQVDTQSYELLKAFMGKNMPSAERTIAISPEIAQGLGGMYKPGQQVPETEYNNAVRIFEAQAGRDAARTNAALANARKQSEPLSVKEKVGYEMKLGKEWSALDVLPQQAARATSIINAIGTEGKVADDALIREFLLSMEPKSVVRQSEFDGVRQMGSLMDQFKAKFEAYTRGGVLAPEQRADLIRTAQEFYKTSQIIRQQTAEEYRYTADRLGLDQRTIFRASPGIFKRDKDAGLAAASPLGDGGLGKVVGKWK